MPRTAGDAGIGRVPDRVWYGPRGFPSEAGQLNQRRVSLSGSAALCHHPFGLAIYPNSRSSLPLVMIARVVQGDHANLGTFSHTVTRGLPMERRSFQSRTASLAIATAIGLGGVTAQAMDVVVYKAIPDPVPPNIPSLGVEAYSMPEIGDRITLQPGGPRNLKKVEVLLSSWACESGSWNVGDCSTTPGRTFTHPITLNLYNADGSTLGSVTQEFTIPYRPSASGETACPSAPGSCISSYLFLLVIRSVQ